MFFGFSVVSVMVGFGSNTCYSYCAYKIPSIKASYRIRCSLVHGMSYGFSKSISTRGSSSDQSVFASVGSYLMYVDTVPHSDTAYVTR